MEGILGVKHSYDVSQEGLEREGANAGLTSEVGEVTGESGRISSWVNP